METKSDMSNDPKHTDTTAMLVEFPAGVPKPHKMAEYGRSLELILTRLNLADLARKPEPPPTRTLRGALP